MNMQKLAPWNWFKKEEEGGTALPVNRLDQPTRSAHPMARMHHEMDRMFDDFFRDFGLSTPSWSRGLAPSFSEGWLKPSVDISATDREYTIHVELPGISEKDVRVELSGDTLKISGEKKHEQEDKGKEYYSVERSYGSFQRVLSLPEDANGDQIEAKFKNGVMTITLPRKESAKPKSKQIEVKAN